SPTTRTADKQTSVQAAIASNVRQSGLADKSQSPSSTFGLRPGCTCIACVKPAETPAEPPKVCIVLLKSIELFSYLFSMIHRKLLSKRASLGRLADVNPNQNL